MAYKNLKYSQVMSQPKGQKRPMINLIDILQICDECSTPITTKELEKKLDFGYNEAFRKYRDYCIMHELIILDTQRRLGKSVRLLQTTVKGKQLLDMFDK